MQQLNAVVERDFDTKNLANLGPDESWLSLPSTRRMTMPSSQRTVRRLGKVADSHIPRILDTRITCTQRAEIMEQF